MINLEQLSAGVARITLNSPDDRNALSGAMRRALLNGLEQARADGAKVVIVRGDERSFSSGYKLDPGVMRPTTAVEDRARLVEVTEFMRAFRASPVVTIAEIRGYCVAGGTDLMLASDVAIAADDASIGVPNVRGVGITLLFPQLSWLIGPQKAKLLSLTGDFVTGVEAEKYGMVAASFPGAELEDRVRAVAERMSLVPVELLQVTKEALNVAWDTAGFSTTVLRGAELDALSHATKPVIEFWDNVESDGIKAAVQTRDSAFSGPRVAELLVR